MNGSATRFSIIRKPPPPRDDARRRLGFDDSRPVIALAPGSRRNELRYLLPVFLDTLRHISPAPQVLLTVAPSLGEEAIRSQLPAGMAVHFLRGIDYQLIQAADAALVTSGTATLELACLNLPMVVAYRGSFATWLQYCCHGARWTPASCLPAQYHRRADRRARAAAA